LTVSSDENSWQEIQSILVTLDVMTHTVHGQTRNAHHNIKEKDYI